MISTAPVQFQPVPCRFCAGSDRLRQGCGGAGTLPLLPEHAHPLLVPGAFATVVCGLILLMARTKAISQVCGYLILENGIYLFGLLLINTTPLLVEAGILLDLTVAVFVIGIIMDRIQHEFDTLDTQKLTTLHE